ncbi:MAG TPA: diphthamide synthesis protein [Candidatus Nanoarchaeia archaeon]|nr:diphthamide synthesis protein [Candidatus Nanoarchaeia archaeon]
MKTLFVPVKLKNEPNYDSLKKLIGKIPEKKLALCFSNQFIDIAQKIYKKFPGFVYKTQVLGCSNPKFPREVEGILIIGQGKFHSVSLAYESGLPTYILENNSIKKIKDEEIEKMEKREKGAYLGYLHAKKIGILVSTKPGQERMEKALEFKEKVKDKKVYIFISNDIDVSEFENFGIDFWVNTACPRMDLVDAPLINLEKLEKLISGK